MVPDQAERIGQLSRSHVLRAWIASRVVVLAALAAAGWVHETRTTSLQSWDAAWYRDIAVHGYVDAPAGAVRFVPAWPLLGRAVAAVLDAPPGLVLVLLANVLTLGYLHLAREVALDVGLPRDVADRVPAVVALAPAGAVLVMGYSEALFGVLLCVVLLTARRRHWLACAAAGLVIGAVRPTGIVVALPVAIEAWQGLRSAGPADRGARLAAVGAPAVGLASYLAWAHAVYGDALAPFRAQLGPTLRGSTFVNPLQTLGSYPPLSGTTHNAFVGLTLNLAMAVAAIALLVVCARRVPLSFTAYAAAIVVLAVTARDFASLERYVCGALPLLLALALVLADHPRLRQALVLVAPVALFAQAVLVFTGVYLP